MRSFAEQLKPLRVAGRGDYNCAEHTVPGSATLEPAASHAASGMSDKKQVFLDEAQICGEES
ncbi:hypothetical protein WMY93_026897 [Mugilogobius chulae]|uniref:Uncharacterized protein n=1 Tax=Mugilogobius chulae TaxID=88201 RepID=A0AAW0N941_9GOBI